MIKIHVTEELNLFAFKGKRKYKVNIPNLAYRNKHNIIETPHGSMDNDIVEVTVTIRFNLDIELTEKTHSLFNIVGRVLVKETVLIHGLKVADTINNRDIYNTNKDFYFMKKN